jgi:hypothetical protein
MVGVQGTPGMARVNEYHARCGARVASLNRAQNGVILPTVLAVACELHVPVHVGPHAGGWAFDMDLAYPDAVKRKLRRVAESVEAGNFCARPESLIEKLDVLSRDILAKISSGRWTLTTDGRDYLPGGLGCADESSLQDKPQRAWPPAWHPARTLRGAAPSRLRRRDSASFPYRSGTTLRRSGNALHAHHQLPHPLLGARSHARGPGLRVHGSHLRRPRRQPPRTSSGHLLSPGPPVLGRAARPKASWPLRCGPRHRGRGLR